MEIIDVRVRPHTAEFNRDIWPNPHPVFKPYLDRYHAERIYNAFPFTSLKESTQIMQSMGVNRAVIYGRHEKSNATAFDAVQKFPDVYIGMGGVDILKGIGPALKELERCFTEYGFYGVGINPFWDGIYSNDKKYYPLYAYAQAMGKAVHIHSSIHYSLFTQMELGNPRYIDEVAIDFPDLKIIIGHAGRGFGMAGAWIADRHPNVFIDFTAIHPRYMDPQMIHAANSFLKKKVIYGSSMPGLPWNIHEEWKRVIYEANHDRFFWKNVSTALGLKAVTKPEKKTTKKAAKKPAKKAAKKKTVKKK